MFEKMNDDYKKFFDACEELFPDFKARVEAKMKENANALLLQEEQNLTEKIEDQKHHITDLRDSLALAEKNLADLELQRTGIHKQWIAANPASGAASSIRKPTDASKVIRRAFDAIWDANSADADTTYAKSFKRFDNLCNKRCSTTTLFNVLLDIEDVLRHIREDLGEIDIAEELRNYYNAK